MPLGSISQGNRLGIANCAMPYASSFAYNVLNIWYTLPMYQQQLVRSTAYSEGPTVASADWGCNPSDSESSLSQTLREISVVDTQFARRNISQGAQNFFNHRISNWNQIYYLNNEPDAGNLPGSGDPLCNCWDPQERGIDPQYSGYFQPDPNTQFWQPAPDSINTLCGSGTIGRRIRPEVLAWLYLRLKRETEGLGRGHIVLPPSSVDPYGINGNNAAYWDAFFRAVHKDGVTVYGSYEPPISPANLRALHMHWYSWPGTQTPIQQVLIDSTLVRNGVAWYKARVDAWFPGQYPSLPVNVLLSEMGPLWGPASLGYTKLNRPWTGIWLNFRKALSWWNTYLCWLTRRAPFECNLQGWDTGINTVYPCIHEPHAQPFVAPNTPTAPTRNQRYFNIGAWALYTANNAPMIAIPSPVSDPGYQGYQDSFSAFDNDYVNWQGSNWRRTALGACYTVWSQVGPDPVTQNLSTGWASNTQAGPVSTAVVSLYPGYSTVYFPVIKGEGAFGNTEFRLRWIRTPGGGTIPGDGAIYDHGSMMLADIEDSGWITYSNYAGTIYSTMVYPVVLWNPSTTYVALTVEISRTANGPLAWLGRPVGLKGACSWFINQ